MAFVFSSMQQGKMFFFIGITMAAFQGGYARRIQPGQQIRTIHMVSLLVQQHSLLVIHSPSQEHETNTHSLRIQHIIFIFKDCRLTMLTNINKGSSQSIT